MNIGVIHATLNAVQPLKKEFYKKNPGITLVNFVNEELLAHANRVGGVDDWGLRNFTRLFMQAAESDVDGIIIACSLYSTYVDRVKILTDKPVIAIDAPMIEAAARKGNKIGVIATTAAAGPAENEKILKEAERLGRHITTSVEIRTEAMMALKRGNVAEHNRILREAVEKLALEGCDTVVLSQITMACAKEDMKDLQIDILSSPESGAEYMNVLLSGRQE